MPNITPPSPNTNMSTVSGSSNSTLPSMNVTNVSAVSDMPAGNSASSPTVSAPQNITQGTLERQTTDEAMMLAEERDSSYSDQPSWDWLNEWQDDESARVSHRRVRRDGDQAACSDDQIEFNGGKLPKDYSNQESYNLTSITAELAKLNFTGILKEADKAQFAAEVIKQIIYKADKNTAALRDAVKTAINYTQITNKTHKAYFTPFVCFATASLGATVAVFLQSKLNVHNSILALVLGAIVGYLGLVPKNILEHGKSSGFVTMAVFAAIIPSLAKIQFGDLISMGISLTIIFVASLVGIYVIVYLLPTWKLVGSRNLAVGIAMGQLLGFPATYLVANEVSRAVAKNNEEYEVIMAKIGPAYVVSGMATVTTLSIVIAGIMVNFL